MFGSTLLVAVMGLSLGLDDVQKKDDQEKARTLTLLQGDWKVTLLIVDGRSVPAEALAKVWVSVRKQRVTINIDGAELVSTIDEAQGNRGRIQFSDPYAPKKRPEELGEVHALCSVEPDRVQLSFRADECTESAKALGKATPTGLVLIVLERKKG